MDVAEFRRRGKEVIDFIADYHEALNRRPPATDVLATATNLDAVIADEAPTSGVPWDELMATFSRHILPGVTPWQHPHFFSFFPHGNSFPSVCADLLSTGLGSVSFKNDVSPAFVELEAVVMRWMARVLDLPTSLRAADSGALIVGSAGEAMNAATAAARNGAIRRAGGDPHGALSRLVMFCSSEAHVTVRKAAELFLVQLRTLPVDSSGVLCPDRLYRAIEEEVRRGKTPFMVVATVGTTATCAVDSLARLGPVCERFGCWLHVDGAYAATACICPEYREWMDGIEFADSLVVNVHKWMLVDFDCSLFWIKEFSLLRTADTEINPAYSVTESDAKPFLELMYYFVPFGRRFRALKLWFVLSTYGISGIQEHIRKHIRLADEFKTLMAADQRFQIVDARAALVCFRLKAGCKATERLEEAIRASGRLDIRSAIQPGTGDRILRFAVCSSYTTSADIQYAVGIIRHLASSDRTPTALSEINGTTAITSAVVVSDHHSKNILCHEDNEE